MTLKLPDIHLQIQHFNYRQKYTHDLIDLIPVMKQMHIHKSLNHKKRGNGLYPTNFTCCLFHISTLCSFIAFSPPVKLNGAWDG